MCYVRHWMEVRSAQNHVSIECNLHMICTWLVTWLRRAQRCTWSCAQVRGYGAIRLLHTPPTPQKIPAHNYRCTVENERVLSLIWKSISNGHFFIRSSKKKFLVFFFETYSFKLSKKISENSFHSKITAEFVRRTHENHVLFYVSSTWWLCVHGYGKYGMTCHMACMAWHGMEEWH